MPTIYLSPSTQELNEYINGGNDEYYMNLIVDAMIPYLRVSGIGFSRNNPGDSISEIVEQVNAGSYDLFLALESAEAPEEFSGLLQGINIYHYAYTSLGGEVAANIIANNLKMIYPHPNLVTVIPNFILVELAKTDPPAVIAQLGYRDNPEDAKWIKDNIDTIAKNLVISIANFLNLEFRIPDPHTYSE